MLDIRKAALSSRLLHRALRRRALCTIVSCELQACTNAAMSALRTAAPYRRHYVGSANYGFVPTSPYRLKFQYKFMAHGRLAKDKFRL
ncbi:unnamed protein product [Cochlearia groenlandica]